MARLFLTEREINFISDLTKEVIHDINGQEIVYYPISELKTLTHNVYNEAVEKIFDNPIKIGALVDAKFQQDTQIGVFGVDQQYKIEVFVQYRDMVERGINISIGDMFSFGNVFYEISDVTTIRTIYGQPEHRDGVKISGIKARESLFKSKLIGPTDIKYTDADAVQTEFHQQRGFAENADGPTGDTRALQENGLLEKPIDGPREVSIKGDPEDAGSAFYDE